MHLKVFHGSIVIYLALIAVLWTIRIFSPIREWEKYIHGLEHRYAVERILTTNLIILLA